MSRSDFNNDGFDDLAIGVRGETVDRRAAAGAANVLYGSAPGLTATGDQYWSQNTRGVLGAAGSEDSFGRALASGDFDNDGYDDLVVGALYEDFAGLSDAGAINVLGGSESGLTAVGDQYWTQNTRGVRGVAASEDHFGEDLAVGDFDNDGYDDLAISAHFKDLGAATHAGALNVLQGSASGLTAAGNQYWHQDSRGVVDSAESDDAFATALAAGDFNNDGYDDLAVGAHREDIGSIEDAGAVNVLQGSATGLTAAGDRIWHQNSAGVLGAAEADDRFGRVLAVGDFDNDGFADLAIGASNEDVGSVADAGAVNVLHGSTAGLTAAGDQFWHQNSAGVAGAAESGDLFGDTLAVGDFDNDGYDDLAIGASGQGVGSIAGAGAVSVLYGSGSGLAASGDQLWHQNSRGVRDVAETDDHFGASLSVGDFNNDGYDDLVIGATGEDIGSAQNAGAANVLFGSAAGLTATDDQLWHQNASGVLGTAQADDLFGFVLA